MVRGIHCCPNFFVSFLLPDQCLYMCIYTHTWLRRDCVLITVATKLYCNWKNFVHNRERCEVLTGCLSLSCRPGGGWANTWFLDILEITLVTPVEQYGDDTERNRMSGSTSAVPLRSWNSELTSSQNTMLESSCLVWPKQISKMYFHHREWTFRPHCHLQNY